MPLVGFLQFHLAVEFGDHITVIMSPRRRTASFTPLTDLRVAARMRLFVLLGRVIVPAPLHTEGIQ